jgi:hypothetical protein
MEYAPESLRSAYIYHIPILVIDEVEDSVDIATFCEEVEAHLPASLLEGVEVVYIGNFSDLDGRNAAFSNAAIYMTANEPTTFDMLENFVHETAHSLEGTYGWQIYDDELKDEFLGKRQRLYHLLTAEGFYVNPKLYNFIEYNKTFDEFLAQEVGYPTLLNITMGLFVSPYGATSLQEYFANGFEKYFLDDPSVVRAVSPILCQKIEEIINDEA